MNATQSDSIHIGIQNDVQVAEKNRTGQVSRPRSSPTVFHCVFLSSLVSPLLRLASHLSVSGSELKAWSASLTQQALIVPDEEHRAYTCLMHTQ